MLIILKKNKIHFPCILSKAATEKKDYSYCIATILPFECFHCLRVKLHPHLPQIVILKHLVISWQVFSNDGYNSIILPTIKYYFLAETLFFSKHILNLCSM